MMDPLREQHLRYQQEDRKTRAARHDLMDRRGRREPGAEPECRNGTRHDPAGGTTCLWCRREVAAPVPEPRAPYDENQGSIQIGEMYDYHQGEDEADLPHWLHGAVPDAA